MALRFPAAATACLLLTAAAPAIAQTSYGEVHVEIIGPDNVAMHGVDVTLETIGALGTRITVRSGAAGQAIFTRVAAGLHRARATVHDVNLTSGEFRVSTAEAVFVQVTPPGANGEPAETRISRRYRLSYGTEIGPNALEDLPGGEGVWPLIETVEPFTFSDRMDTGGLSTGQPALLGSHGSSWTQTTLYTGTMDVTDMYRGGVPLFYPDLRALDAVIVTSALAPIEHDAPGPVITVIPRRPSTEWHGWFGGGIAPGAPQSDRMATTPARIETLNGWSRGHLLLSGPLVKDRAGLVLSGTMIRSDHVERHRAAELAGDFSSLAAHLLLTPREGDEVSIVGGFQRTKHAFGGRALFESRDAVERDTFASLQTTWERTLRSGASWHAGASYNRGRFLPDIAVAKRGGVERLYDGPVPELAFAASGEHARWSSNVGFDFAPRAIKRALHAFRLGATATGSAATTRPLDAASGLVPELVGGVPARVWDYGYGGPESRWREHTIAAHGADRIVMKRLTTEIGLRGDVIAGSAEAGSQTIRWRTWSPRISARWTPFSDRVAFIGGYGRFHYQLPLSYFAFGDPTGPQGSAYRWRDPNHDGVFQASERGPLIARVGPGSTGGRSAIDPGLARPRAHEYVIGTETLLTSTLRLRFVGIARREHHLIAGINVGVPDSDYDVAFVEDPGLDFGQTADDQLLPIFNRRSASFGRDEYLLTNPAGLTAGYEGFELTVDRRLTGRWQWLFGAAMCRSRGSAANRGFQAFENDQGVIGELLTNPNATRVAEGRLFFERGYTIKTSATYRGPGDVRAGIAARYQDGQHFARMVIAQGLNQGTEGIQALPNGKVRYTFALTIDARVEKRFDVGPFRLGAAIEAFNLLNTRNEVEEDVISGPNFRAPTAWQPAPVVRVGFNVSF
jgi:hypothetical protein